MPCRNRLRSDSTVTQGLNRLLTFSDDPVKGEGGRLVNHAVRPE
jgi:hypothetical protein